jgi:hypothetical protein
MADHPDFYSDGFSINVNEGGVSLSFTRGEPAVPGVQDEAGRVIVVRVRMARVVAEALGARLQQAMSRKAGNKEQTITH